MTMTFVELPPDIIFTLVYLLDAMDIIHLGQTCKILRRFCEERTVWTSITRRIRADNAVFPVFSVKNEHSVDTLRHETTAPARFVSLLKNSHISGYSVLPRWSRFVSAPEDGEVFTILRLIPGGHVLVTASNIALRIWDVDEEQPRLLHTMYAIDPDILAMARTRDNDLRLAVTVKISGKSALELRIFDYNIQSSTSKFYSFSLDLWTGQRHTPLYAISLDYFIFMIGAVLHAWEFTHNRYTRWSVPHHRYERIDSETTPHLIILMTSTKVYGWKPKTCSNSLTNLNDSTNLPTLIPDYVLDIPPIIEGGIRIQRSLASWYGSTEYSLLFDFATKHAGEPRYTFTSYEIHPPKGDDIPGYVEHISTEQLPKRPSASNLLQIYVYRVAHNRLFKTWFNDSPFNDEGPPSCIKVAFRDNPRTTNDGFEDDPCIEVDLKLPTKLGLGDNDPSIARMNDANLDPASGRLCYLLLNSNCVGLVGYLSKW